MNQTIHRSESHCRILEDLAPFAERLVCRDQKGTAFIPGTDQLEQHGGLRLIFGHPRSPTSWTLKPGQNRLSEGQIRAKRRQNDPSQKFAILIVALATLIDARQIFYALALAVAADPGDKSYANQLEAGRLLEKLFAQEPTHPGLAHYIIHPYDVPALAGQALGAAQRYSEIAPDAPHALHMPSHTFTRLGLWQASIDSNVAAAARRQGQTAEELHASNYETYAYLQTAQDEAVKGIVKSAPEMASRFNPEALLIGAGPPAAGYSALAAIPA